MPTRLELLIERYPDKEWNWGMLSKNPSITPYIIEKYIEGDKNRENKPWDWHAFETNPNITFEFMKKYKKIEWGRSDSLYLNKGLSVNGLIDFILENGDEPTMWYYLSKHPFLTWDQVKRNIGKNWNMRPISNSLIDINIITNYGKPISLNLKSLSLDWFMEILP